LRSVRMKRFIFGFQRRVWCPKWTPLSRSWRMVTTAMMFLLLVVDPHSVQLALASVEGVPEVVRSVFSCCPVLAQPGPDAHARPDPRTCLGTEGRTHGWSTLRR